MEECNNANIPDRLHTKGRVPNQSFDPEEYLFRRFKNRKPFSEWVNSTDISASIFPVDSLGDSFNRELYCESYADVLLNENEEGGDLDNYGVVGVKCKVVHDCPSKTDDNGNVYSLNIIHDPTPCMFPHTILKVYINGIDDHTKKYRPAKALFRDELKSKCELFKPVDMLERD